MTRPLFVAPSLNELEARLERRALALHLPSLLVAHNLDLDAGVLAACLEPRPAAGLPSGCESSCFRVLDMCAAPGGKCFHIADRLSACFAAAALSVPFHSATLTNLRILVLGRCIREALFIDEHLR